MSSPSRRLSLIVAVLSHLGPTDLPTITAGIFEISTTRFVFAMLTTAPGRERMCQEIFDIIEAKPKGRTWMERLESMEYEEGGGDSEIATLVDSLKESKSTSSCFTLWTEQWLTGLLLPMSAANGMTPPGTPNDGLDEEFPPSLNMKRQRHWKEQLYDRDGYHSPLTGAKDMNAPPAQLDQMVRDYPELHAHYLRVVHLIPFTAIDNPMLHEYIRRFMNNPNFPLSPVDFASLANAMMMEGFVKDLWNFYRISIECVPDPDEESAYKHTYVLKVLDDDLVGRHVEFYALRGQTLPWLYRGVRASEFPRLSPEFCDLHYALAKAVNAAGLQNILWRLTATELEEAYHFGLN